jgi:hypothetical protein
MAGKAALCIELCMDMAVAPIEPERVEYQSCNQAFCCLAASYSKCTRPCIDLLVKIGRFDRIYTSRPIG